MKARLSFATVCLLAFFLLSGYGAFAQTSDGSACGTIAPDSIAFADGSARITPAMQSALANLTAQMLANPECKVIIVGSAGGTKLNEQLGWDRVNAITEYMSEKNNIDRNRFIWHLGEGAFTNSVGYRAAGVDETGSSTLPMPHPDLHH